MQTKRRKYSYYSTAIKMKSMIRMLVNHKTLFGCIAFLLQAGVLSAYNPANYGASQRLNSRTQQEDEQLRQQAVVEKNTDRSANRQELSPNCLAHSSAIISKIDIRESSPQKGLGAFATIPINCGTYLGEYAGECMTLGEVQARFWGKRTQDVADEAWAESRRCRNQDITGHYVFEILDGSFICAEDGEQSTWTRFMNHAPEGSPTNNVKAFMQTVAGGDTHRYPRFFAIRDIEPGEELQWDYGIYFTKNFSE